MCSIPAIRFDPVYLDSLKVLLLFQLNFGLLVLLGFLTFYGILHEFRCLSFLLILALDSICEDGSQLLGVAVNDLVHLFGRCR